MMSSPQLRAARALIRCDQSKVAEAAAVSIETIKRLKEIEGPLESVRVNMIDAIQRALEAAGVIFIETNGEGSGVRLRGEGGSEVRPMTSIYLIAAEGCPVKVGIVSNSRVRWHKAGLALQHK